MGSRGHKSTAETLTQPGLTVLETRRSPPPPGLTEAEAAVWRETMAAAPSGWFTKASYPVLKAFCRHTARAELLAQQVNGFQPEWITSDGGLERLNKLLAMAERESRALTACARAMRLTQQSQYGPRAAATAVQNARGDAKRPWDREEREYD
jgi:hypothetical protein